MAKTGAQKRKGSMNDRGSSKMVLSMISKLRATQLPGHGHRDHFHCLSNGALSTIHSEDISDRTLWNSYLKKRSHWIEYSHRKRINSYPRLLPIPAMLGLRSTTASGGQQTRLAQAAESMETKQTPVAHSKGTTEEKYGSEEMTTVDNILISTPQKEYRSLGEELRMHSRHIRDVLSPLLSREPLLTRSDSATLHSIFKLLEGTTMTLELLRFSRMEKALQLIVAIGPSVWPIGIIVQAENMIRKWEDQLGQGTLKNLRADLWGSCGRLEGVRRIKDWRHGDDDANSAWEVEGAEASNAYQSGDLGFEVGHWWLKEAAAFRDGIIDESSHAITSDENGAYAIVLSGNCEQNLRSDDQFEYHARKDEPNGFMLSKTMTKSDPELKVVRVLRSYKLRSRLAPKAGVRYDGLYRITSYGFKPKTWQIHATLSRLPEQPPIPTTLPSDMLDDWKDYQHFKKTDRGEDFAILRDILRDDAVFKDEEDEKASRLQKYDSGYYSRPPSLVRAQSRMETPESSKEIDFVLVAEGTPSESGTSTYRLGNDGAGDVMELRGGGLCFSRNGRKATNSESFELGVAALASDDRAHTPESDGVTTANTIHNQHEEKINPASKGKGKNQIVVEEAEVNEQPGEDRKSGELPKDGDNDASEQREESGISRENENAEEYMPNRPSMNSSPLCGAKAMTQSELNIEFEIGDERHFHVAPGDSKDKNPLGSAEAGENEQPGENRKSGEIPRIEVDDVNGKRKKSGISRENEKPEMTRPSGDSGKLWGPTNMTQSKFEREYETDDERHFHVARRDSIEDSRERKESGISRENEKPEEWMLNRPWVKASEFEKEIETDDERHLHVVRPDSIENSQNRESGEISKTEDNDVNGKRKESGISRENEKPEEWMLKRPSGDSGKMRWVKASEFEKECENDDERHSHVVQPDSIEHSREE